MARVSFPRTISRGPLAGSRFTTQMDYMNARARALGFRSYHDERQSKLNPMFIAVRERLMERRGVARTESIRQAHEIIGRRRREPRAPGEGHALITEIMTHHYDLFDSGQEAADQIYYE